MPRAGINGEGLAQPEAGQVKSLVDAGAILVDARSQDEWNAGHAAGAILLPWPEVRTRAAAKLPDKDAPIVTYCAMGARAALAAGSLRELGYTRAVAMAGGLVDLINAGYPIETA